MSAVVIVYHSGYGHTAAVAEAVATGVRSVAGATATLVKAEEADKNWEVMAKADALIFGSPTYMGSVSAPFKGIMDASSKVWMGQGWKDKLAAGFTNSASQSGDKLNTLVQLMIFAMQHGMVWVGLDLMPGNNSSGGSTADLNRLGSFSGVMTQANNDQDAKVAPPESDRQTAAALGKRVALAAQRWGKA